MDPNEAVRRTRELLSEFDLNDWIVELDRSKRRFGQCRYGPKVIGLSETLVSLNSWERVRRTALHEIAHAIAFVRYGASQHHNYRWQQICAEIGIPGESRCYDPERDGTVTVPYKYRILCLKCNEVVGYRDRKRREMAERCVSNCCKSKLAFVRNI